MTKYCLLLAAMLVPGSLWAQCANTAYGPFTCVQAPTPIDNGGSGPSAAVTVSFTNTTTPGNGILIFGYYCHTLNCASGAGTPLPNVYVTDDAMDTGFQPCQNNGGIAASHFYFCWWLPVVGAAKTFVMHANGSYNAGMWLAEFAGGCNTSGCIGTDVAPATCMGPCGITIVTTNTNVLVTGWAVSSQVLSAASGWHPIVCWFAACGIGNFQPAPGPYTPSWTNALGLVTMAASIKARTGSVSTEITIPTMPVF